MQTYPSQGSYTGVTSNGSQFTFNPSPSPSCLKKKTGGVEGRILYGNVTYNTKEHSEAVIKIPYSQNPKESDNETRGLKILQDAGLHDHDNIALSYGMAENESQQKGIVIKKYKHTILASTYLGWHKLHAKVSKTKQQKTCKITQALLKGIATITEDMLKDHRGLRHNDLHLGNVMYEQNDAGDYIAKIIDFGRLSEATEKDNEILGFTDYISHYQRKKNDLINSPEYSKYKKDYIGAVIDRVLLGSSLEHIDEQKEYSKPHPIGSILAICKNFNNLFEKQPEIIEQCKNVLQKEKSLEYIHIILNYFSTNKDKEFPNTMIDKLPEELRDLAKEKDINAIKEQAAKTAAEIKSEGSEIFAVLKTI